VTVTATIPAPNASPITFRQGTLFSGGGIEFEIDQDYVMPAGGVTLGLGALQGKSFTEDFTSAGITSQKFQVSQFPVIQNSVQVFVDDVLWEEIDFFAFAGPLDQVYTLSFDENNKGTIQFGDDVFGAIPAPGALVRILYRVGGGSEGNITAGAVQANIPAFINNITLTSVSITNNTAASGGSDEESIEHAKLFIPRELKTIGHAVTDDDYDTLAAGFSDPAAGTVAKANAALRGGELNKIDIFVWTRQTDGTLTGASLALRNALKAFIVEVNVISHDVAVFSGLTEPVNVAADITYQASRTDAEITDTVTTALEDFFNSDTLDPGEAITLSSLYNLIHNLDGIQSVIITDPTADVAILEARIAVLGTITLTLTAAELGT
jgi:predicted phage baseplate assembly protein